MKHVTKTGVAIATSLLACTLCAAMPQWWTDRGIIDTNAVVNDYAPVNQGQVKHVATQAYLEFEQKLTNDCSTVSNLVSGFSSTNNYLSVNLGQLKAVAQPFYDLLWANDYTNAWPDGMTVGPYPWSGSTNDAQDFAIANIGQLKYLFSFNLTFLAPDADTDGDGLPDWYEVQLGTDPVKWDTDGDWLSDGWEVEHSLNALVSDASLDSDNDGLSNRDEYQYGTDPFNADSDGDGMPDAWEVNAGTDAQTNDAASDPDNDGLINYDEYIAGTNPLKPDTDEDGIPDGFEVDHGMNPLSSLDVMDDPDGDMIPNYYEYLHGETDPSNPASVPTATAVVSTNGHDSTFTNIQEAVNAAAANEYPIILIEPGNYSIEAAIELTLTNVLIYAAPGTVVLDGGGSNRLFNAVSGWPVLAGLTLQNGYSSDDGGAIYVSEAKPVIRNCLFLSNWADGNGGAMYFDSYALESRNCVFQDNEAEQGGAVYCENAGTEFISCTWMDNYAESAGGAVYGCSLIRNGRFVSNQSDGDGGAVYSAGDASEILNCVFQGNAGYYYDGGAVYCENVDTKMIHCTWIENYAGSHGAAVYGGWVVNGIVWSNTTLSKLSGKSIQIYDATVSYSCVENGYIGMSNITNNPGLVQTWHLASSASPCVNSGNPTNAAVFDLDGELRDALPDIGADEWVDSDADGLPDWWEIQWFTNLNVVADGNLPTGDSAGRMTYVQKYLHGLDPGVSDFDGDGLSDYAEAFIYKTDPLTTNALDTSTGYILEPTNYDWIDISQTGQAITNFSQLDDGMAQVSLGIQFPLFDTTYNTAYVCNNGFISFGTYSTDWDNEPLPSTEIPEKTLCVFWDDLWMAGNPEASVYIQTISNRCVISFEDIPFLADEIPQSNSFQVVLYDDGSILYQYKAVCSDETPPTVGMQWDAGESVEFSAGNLTNGTALLIHTDGLNTDFDSDGVRDVWETKWFGNLNTVINGSEFISQSNRFTYAEAAYLDLNPNTADTDGDGLSDTYEVEHGLNPVVQQDSDGDGMPDLFETAQGLDSADSADALADDDGDGFPNVYEYRHDTDLFESNSVPLPDRYVSLTGQHIAPFTNSATAATNLQAVLLAAAPYDIILVADGTYTGAENRNLDFLGKPLMLLSENGPTNCILDCENENRGFYLKNNAGSVIQGIQILQGFSGWDTSPGNGLGGAVCCINVNLLFENCCFLSNTAVDAGGVVYAENSSIIFKNSVFKDNGTDDPYLWGGLCCFPGSSFEGSSIEIFGCTITGTLGDEGIVFNGSDFLLQNNVFSNNVCCVLDGDDSTGSINNCVFVENQSSYRSGGAFFSDSDVMFANCVFKNNSVESSGTQSGALFLWGGALLAQNCLFSENSSEAGVVNLYQGFIWLENCTLFSNQCPALCNSVLGDLIVRNTILWGNESGSYDTDQWGLDIEFSCLPETVGTNNIHVDPMLISETGGLLPNSPCIDRSSDLIAPATDMQGTPRWDHPWRSNGVDSSIADIGAFEFTDSDTDADGLGDKWEIYYFTNITFSAGSEDFDSDGLSTSDEYHLNTNPTLADTDGDGLSDGAEVNSYGTNPLSTDSDGDGLSDYAEINSYGTNPLFADSDNDGLPDGWEVASSLNPLLGSDASADADSDGLSNLAEYTLGTGFQSSDSDSDGIPDGWEVSNNLNPLVDDSASDPDSDGLSNLAEYNNGVNSTDPQDTDSDDDGMPNAWESTHGLDLSTNEASGDPDGDGLTNLQEYQAQTNPQVADTDDDMLNDGEEISIYHTNPLLRDTDGDGYTDGAEIQQGRDPLVADSLYSPFLYSLSVDADDNGQLNIDEAHRLPMFTVNVGFDYDQYFSPPLTNYPPNDYYAVPSDLLNFLFQGAAAVNPLWMVSLSRATNYSWVSWLSQSSPQQVQSKTFMGNSGDVYSTNDIYSVSFPESCRVLGYGMVLSSHFSSDASGHIYPYSSDYSVEKGRAGAFSRRMSVFLSDGSADTNKMGLVVFKQMVIHSNAPTPHIYLSASPDVHLYRASTGQPITFYERGEPWDGSEDIDDYNQSKPGFSGIEDIGNELRSGDLAILVEGIAPSSPPNQTADKVIDEWFGRYPPFYGLPHNPTTQGSWGTYVGLCCKEDEDRYPAFANDMLRFSVEIKPEIHLIPDWNRDRQIDNTDKTWNTNSSPYRFWVNDDSDSGDIAEGDSDIPGQTGSWLPGSRTPNCKDQKVNGRSDLTDFFPVWLDIASALTNYPPANGIEYRLSQAGSAVQFVYTDLTASDAGDYLITDVSSCGPSFNQNVYQADTLLIPESGVELNSAFLDRIAANPDKGVLLIEAIDVLVEKTDILNAPLLLTVVSNNTILAYTQLPLSLSGVEQMFRHKNLRAEIGGDEQVPLRDTAPNWPDSLCSTTNLFFLHGVNTTEQGARGWQSEFFKRFYWSGSKARFHGITWYGDKGSDANYQENANHAFQTALYLKDYVSSVSGTKIMLAHSLGNIVVSSAIQDYGMSVSKYLMLDAAVASEAFDASMFNAATNNNPMLHAGWREYEPQAWSVNFHNLYSPPDLRAALTWQNRFAAVVSVAYNFYNSEDEVFEIHPDSVSTLTGVDFDYLFIPDDFEHYTWQKQEVFKGRDSSWLPGSLGSTKWWGWGFEKNWLGQTVSPEEANGLSTNELKNSPVFRHSPDWYIHVDNLTTDAVNEMLAMGLPAMSPSAGQVSVVSIQNNGGGNFDISTLKNGWPRNHETYLARWLHSDCRDVAYLYTYRLFDELVTEGVLK